MEEQGEIAVGSEPNTLGKIQNFLGAGVKAVTDSVGSITDSITGKNLETRIDEYTKVYGDILLGMHKEIQVQKDTLARTHDQVERLTDAVKDLKIRLEYEAIQELVSSLRLYRTVSLFSFLLSFGALAVVVVKLVF